MRCIQPLSHSPHHKARSVRSPMASMCKWLPKWMQMECSRRATFFLGVPLDLCHSLMTLTLTALTLSLMPTSCTRTGAGLHLLAGVGHLRTQRTQDIPYIIKCNSASLLLGAVNFFAVYRHTLLDRSQEMDNVPLGFRGPPLDLRCHSCPPLDGNSACSCCLVFLGCHL